MSSHVLAWSCTVCHQVFLTQDEAAIHHLSCKDQVESGSLVVGPDGNLSILVEDPMPVDVKEELVMPLETDYEPIVTTSSVDYVSLHQPHYEVMHITQNVAAEEVTSTAEPISHHDLQLSTAIKSIGGTTNSPPKQATPSRQVTMKLSRTSPEEGEILETIDPSMISMATTRNHPVSYRNNDDFDDGGPPYTCKVCAKSFESRIVLDMHWKSEHYIKAKSYRWRCTQCARSFRKQNEFVQHEQAHADGRKMHKCNICNFAYAIKLGLQSHNKTVHAVKDKMCPFCNKAFSHKGYLNNHMLAHTATRHLPCTICGQFFKTAHMLASHNKLHCNEKCAHCDLVFTWKPAYEKHILTHTRKKQLECRTCGKILSRLQQFKIHTEKCEKKEHKPRMCRLCGKYFSDFNELRKHKEQHPKPSLECEKCGKCLYTKTNLIDHMKIHTHAYNFECRRCCIKFKSRESLRSHIQSRGHKIGKSFVCPICERGFYSVQILNLHMRAHVLKTCGLCGAVSLGEAGHLQHRQRMHPDGERNVECTTCSLKFPSFEILADHEKYYCQGKKWEPEPKETVEPEVQPDLEDTTAAESQDVVIPKKEDGISNENVKITPKGERLHCTYCEAHFPAVQYLRYHMRQDHDVPYIYKCRLCEKYFEKRHLLEEHVNEIHDTGKKKTVVKNETTGAIQMVIEKVLSNNTASCVYSCDYCGTEFEEKAKMEGHVLTCAKQQSGESETPSIVEFYKIDKGKGKMDFTYECVNCEEKFDKRIAVEEHIPRCLSKGKQSTSEIAGSPLVATGFKLNTTGSKLNTTWSRVNTPYSPPNTAANEAVEGINKLFQRRTLHGNENNEDTVETIYATYGTQRVTATAEPACARTEKGPPEKPGKEIQEKSGEDAGQAESGDNDAEPAVIIKQPKLVYFKKKFYDPVAIMERWESVGCHFTSKDFLISDDEEFDPEMIAEDEKLLADLEKEKAEHKLKFSQRGRRRQSKKNGVWKPKRNRSKKASEGVSPKVQQKRVRARLVRATTKEAVADGHDSDFDEGSAAIESSMADIGNQPGDVPESQPVKSTHIVIEKARSPNLAAGAVFRNRKDSSLQTPSPVFAAGGKTVNINSASGTSETVYVPTFTLTLSGVKPGSNQIQGFMSLGSPKTPTSGIQTINAKASTPNVINLTNSGSNLKISGSPSARGTPASGSPEKFHTAMSAGIQVKPFAALKSPTPKKSANKAEALRNVIRSGKLPNNGITIIKASATTDDDSDEASDTDDIVGAVTKNQAKKGPRRPGKKTPGQDTKQELTPSAIKSKNILEGSAQKSLSSAQKSLASAPKNVSSAMKRTADAASLGKSLGSSKNQRVEVKTKSGRRSIRKFRFDEEFVTGDELDDDSDGEDDLIVASDHDDDDYGGFSGGSGFGDDDDDVQIPSNYGDDNDDGDVSTEVANGTVNSQTPVQSPSRSTIQTRTSGSGIKKVQITSKLGQPNLTNIFIEYKPDPKCPGVANDPSDAFYTNPKKKLSHQVKKKILASTSVKDVLGMLKGTTEVENSNREMTSLGTGVGNSTAISEEKNDSTVGTGIHNKVAAPKVDENTSKDGKKVDLRNVGSQESNLRKLSSTKNVALNPCRRTCTICGNAFDTLAEFSQHTTSHFTGTKWQCSYCGQSIHCDFLTHLGHHMMCWRTGKLKNKFKCPRCETITGDNVLFEAHIRNHVRLGQMSAEDVAGDDGAGVGDGEDKNNDEGADVGLEDDDDDDADDVEDRPAADLTKTDKVPIVLLEKLDLMEKPGREAQEKRPAIKSGVTTYVTANTSESTDEGSTNKRRRGRPKANKEMAKKNPKQTTFMPNIQKQKTFTCKKCEAVFENAADIQEHLLSHTLSVACWKCRVCQEAFKSYEYNLNHPHMHIEACPHAYSKHVQDHVRLIPVYACNICATKFTTQKELNMHVKSHVGRNFVCGDCDKVFETIEELTTHDKTGECHQARKLKCPQCNLPFRKAQDLGRHLMADVCANSVVCSKCENVFSSKERLLQHNCAAGKRLVCPKCTERFKSEMEFAEHFLRNACRGAPKATKVQASAASGRPTRSSDLGMDTDWGVGLDQEDDVEDDDIIPQVKSTRKRARNSDTRVEELEHVPKAKKACAKPSVVDRGAKQSENITKAKRGRPKASSAVGRAEQREVTPKAKKVQTKSSSSDKSSQQPGDLSKELHVCSHCGRNFKNHQNMMVHEPACGALKPFGCDNCKRRFDFLKHLRNHRCKTSTGTWNCKICKKQFNNSKSLRKHPCTRTYYKCDRCKRHFVTQRNYQYHLCCVKQIFKCQKCKTRVQSEKLLAKHYEQCETAVPGCITCPECRKRLPTKYLFRLHLERKFCGRDVFDCFKCGREFHKETTKSHHKCVVPKTFVCTRCPKEFNNITSARKHRCKPTKFQCMKCNVRFETKKALLDHENGGCRFSKRYRQTETGQVVRTRKTVEEVAESKLSECVCCFYMFGTQKDLAEHYCESFGADGDLKGRMCKEQNWIHCSVCGGNFGLKKQFREHDCKTMARKKCPGCEGYGLEKDLYEENLWHCILCNVDFDNFENFSVNSGMAVRFECTTCLKNFETTESLAQHDCCQLSCLACKEIFRSPGELEEHVSHCRMKCSSCKQVFATEDDLAGHVLGTDLNGCLGAYMPKKAGTK